MILKKQVGLIKLKIIECNHSFYHALGTMAGVNVLMYYSLLLIHLITTTRV